VERNNNLFDAIFRVRFCVISMMEEMALDYFRSLSKGEKKRLLKKLVGSMSEEERVELAKLLLKK
jgi:hypothetical protein